MIVVNASPRVCYDRVAHRVDRGGKWIATACGLLQGQYTSGPSSISQKAAEAAYTGSQDCVEEMRLAFKGEKPDHQATEGDSRSEGK